MAEEQVARRLIESGWSILARQLRVGRGEIDILATDPGPPGRLVVVEVRWRSGRAFGQVEETFDWRKRAQLVRACHRLLAARLPDGRRLPRLPIAVDLVVVEPNRGGPGIQVRHHRDVLAA